VRTETEALKRPFLIGVLFVAIVLVFLGGLISLFGSTDDRPEGVAERWLTAVGDLSRKGVHDDAAKRVAADGDPKVAEILVGGGFDYEGKSAFTALEVGKAPRVDDRTARVPAKVTYRGKDNGGTSRGVLTMERSGDSWRIVGIESPDPALKVPSDGGDVAAKAPITLYLVALVIGVGVAAGASALVRAAGREHESSPSLLA
jgi:hypothetical protein